jgi:hypothetical protein
MPRLVGFNTFAALPEEQITEIRRRILAGNQAMLVGEALPPPSVGAFCLVRLAPDLGAPAIGTGEREMRPGRQSTSEVIHLPVCQLDKAGIAGPFPSAI